MAQTQYQLHLKGYVGGYDFDADYVDYILAKNAGKEVHVLIDSLGGQSSTALSIFSAFRRHGNVNAHFVGASPWTPRRCTWFTSAPSLSSNGGT